MFKIFTNSSASVQGSKANSIHTQGKASKQRDPVPYPTPTVHTALQAMVTENGRPDRDKKLCTDFDIRQAQHDEKVALFRELKAQRAGLDKIENVKKSVVAKGKEVKASDTRLGALVEKRELIGRILDLADQCGDIDKELDKLDDKGKALANEHRNYVEDRDTLRQRIAAAEAPDDDADQPRTRRRKHHTSEEGGHRKHRASRDKAEVPASTGPGKHEHHQSSKKKAQPRTKPAEADIQKWKDELAEVVADIEDVDKDQSENKEKVANLMAEQRDIGKQIDGLIKKKKGLGIKDATSYKLLDTLDKQIVEETKKKDTKTKEKEEEVQKKTKAIEGHEEIEIKLDGLRSAIRALRENELVPLQQKMQDKLDQIREEMLATRRTERERESIVIRQRLLAADAEQQRQIHQAGLRTAATWSPGLQEQHYDPPFVPQTDYNTARSNTWPLPNDQVPAATNSFYMNPPVPPLPYAGEQSYTGEQSYAGGMFTHPAGMPAQHPTYTTRGMPEAAPATEADAELEASEEEAPRISRQTYAGQTFYTVPETCLPDRARRKLRHMDKDQCALYVSLHKSSGQGTSKHTYAVIGNNLPRQIEIRIGKLRFALSPSSDYRMWMMPKEYEKNLPRIQTSHFNQSGKADPIHEWGDEADESSEEEIEIPQATRRHARREHVRQKYVPPKRNVPREPRRETHESYSHRQDRRSEERLREQQLREERLRAKAERLRDMLERDIWEEQIRRDHARRQARANDFYGRGPYPPRDETQYDRGAFDQGRRSTRDFPFPGGGNRSDNHRFGTDDRTFERDEEAGRAAPQSDANWDGPIVEEVVSETADQGSNSEKINFEDSPDYIALAKQIQARFGSKDRLERLCESLENCLDKNFDDKDGATASFKREYGNLFGAVPTSDPKDDDHAKFKSLQGKLGIQARLYDFTKIKFEGEVKHGDLAKELKKLLESKEELDALQSALTECSTQNLDTAACARFKARYGDMFAVFPDQPETKHDFSVLLNRVRLEIRFL